MPTKPKKSRVTPKRTEATPQPKPAEIHVDLSAGLSPKQIDMIRAASGWKMSDLFDEGEPTGKIVAGKHWLATRPVRPDLTPNDFYECEDPALLGIEFGGSEGADSPDPTNAAG